MPRKIVVTSFAESLTKLVLHCNQSEKTSSQSHHKTQVLYNQSKKEQRC